MKLCTSRVNWRFVANLANNLNPYKGRISMKKLLLLGAVFFGILMTEPTYAQNYDNVPNNGPVVQYNGQFDSSNDTACGDVATGDCWCLYCHQEPCYTNEWKCYEENQYFQKQCCRYVKCPYQVKRCRYVPEYYCETCYKYVPEYYCVNECRPCKKWACEKKCTYKPCYYWKHVCGQQGCANPCPTGQCGAR